MIHTPTEIELEYFDARSLMLDCSINNESKNFYIFEKDPEKATHDKVINDNINEKTRKFNNSIIKLAISIKNMTQHWEGLQMVEIPNVKQIIENIYRQECSNIYVNVFVYFEKIKAFMRYFLFLEKDKTKSNKAFLKEVELFNTFKEIESFYKVFVEISNDSDFKDILQVRNDEIHNDSKIDNFIYKLGETPADIINLGYEIKNVTLYETAKNGLVKLKRIKDTVQVIIDKYDRFDIYNYIDKTHM